ncbi:MAG: peptidylprolyl isomerase [Candidatus Gastranaerophilales bacterium]|nr:peptidylprolyl isomerase [Candidatus Gastranaerophilales bacterium]
METIKYSILGEEISFLDAFLSLNSLEARHAVLKELGKRILFQRYFNELQICSDNYDLDVESLLQKFCAQYKISSAEEFENFLGKIKQDKDSFVERLVYEEKIRHLKRLVITSHSINDLFLEKKMRQDSVIFSLLRLEKETIARELYYRLTHDLQDFGEMAKQFSVGAEAKHGGIVGSIQLQTLNPELRSRLVAMNEGDISEPFTVDGSQFLIIKLIRFDRITLNTHIENALRDELFEQWINRQLDLNNFNIQAANLS